MSKERTVAGKYSSVPKDNYTYDPTVDNTGSPKANGSRAGEYETGYESLHIEKGSAAMPVARRRR